MEDEGDGAGDVGAALHGVGAYGHAAVEEGGGEDGEGVEAGEEGDDDAGEADASADAVHEAVLDAEELGEAG